jgi:hypothetical protein
MSYRSCNDVAVEHLAVQGPARQLQRWDVVPAKQSDIYEYHNGKKRFGEKDTTFTFQGKIGHKKKCYLTNTYRQ